MPTSSFSCPPALTGLAKSPWLPVRRGQHFATLRQLAVRFASVEVCQVIIGEESWERGSLLVGVGHGAHEIRRNAEHMKKAIQAAWP